MLVMVLLVAATRIAGSTSRRTAAATATARLMRHARHPPA
jgi:hypothetical protein